MIFTSKHFLDPVLPEPLPSSITAATDRIFERSQFLSSRLAVVTAKKRSGLLCVTNAYYSNLIEGHFADVHLMQKVQLMLLDPADLAVRHMRAQQKFERAISLLPTNVSSEIFAPERMTQPYLPTQYP